MVVYTKSGVTVNCCGNLFIASDGKTYNLCGRCKDVFAINMAAFFGIHETTRN